MMRVKHLDVVKFIAQGNFSMVYEVRSTKGVDKGKSYALKRFYLIKKVAVKCALREQRILKLLATHEIRLFFVQTLVYGLFTLRKPIVVLNKCSGMGLVDILHFRFPLNVQHARFYCSEIIAGLQQIHALGIVHLDIKPSNMLLSHSGHIQITNFACAYDTTRNQRPPKPEDFQGTRYFMAPEIATKQSISFAADIWNVGMTMGRMLSPYTRPNGETTMDQEEIIQLGLWTVKGFEDMIEPLKFFFQSCLRMKLWQRPSIEEIKQMELFSDVNWEVEALMNRTPPYHIAELLDQVEREKHSIDKSLIKSVRREDQPRLRGAVYSARDLVIDSHLPIQYDSRVLARNRMAPDVVADHFNEEVDRTHP